MNTKPLLSSSFISFIKNKRNLLLLISALVGAVIVLLSLFSSGQKQEQQSSDSLAEYKVKIEAELAELCSGVSGAGKCVVNVSFKEGERLEYKGSVLVGRTPPKIQGITVLCRGGESDYVKNEISSMLSALYGIGHNRICVLKLSS